MKVCVFIVAVLGMLRLAPASEPPAFRDLLPEIVEARSLEGGYQFQYDLTMTDMLNESVVSRTGDVLVSPAGFYHRMLHGGGFSNFDDINGSIANQLGNESIQIFDGAKLFQLNPGKARGDWTPVEKLAKGPPAIDFDFRAFGLAVVGDYVTRSSVEKVANNLKRWHPPVDSGWVRDGVAYYQIGDLTYHIDIQRGYWPIHHRFYLTNRETGERTVHSQADLELIEVDGEFLPRRLELTSERMTYVFDLDWQPKPSQDDDRLDGFAVAERLSIDLVEKSDD